MTELTYVKDRDVIKKELTRLYRNLIQSPIVKRKEVPKFSKKSLTEFYNTILNVLDRYEYTNGASPYFSPLELASGTLSIDDLKKLNLIMTIQENRVILTDETIRYTTKGYLTLRGAIPSLMPPTMADVRGPDARSV